MNPFITLIIQSIPGIVKQIQDARAAAGQAPLPPEQVTALFEEAFASTIAKDEIIKAAHGWS